MFEYKNNYVSAMCKKVYTQISLIILWSCLYLAQQGRPSTRLSVADMMVQKDRFKGFAVHTR